VGVMAGHDSVQPTRTHPRVFADGKFIRAFGAGGREDGELAEPTISPGRMPPAFCV
jgi:hypothetical protein